MESRIKDTLLLIGDATSDRSELYDIFDGLYHLLEAENATQGAMLLEQNRECIAAVLADISLGQVDAVRSLISASLPETPDEVPVILLVSPIGTGEREELAFVLGAADVVVKPYTTLSIRKRVQTLVDLFLHRLHLQKLVENQNKAIQHAYETMVDTITTIIEYRSTESGNHVLRIRRFTQLLLQEVARFCPEYQLTKINIDTIVNASAMHDIGKIIIPDNILNKPGRLTDEEYEIIKTHTTVGSQLIEHLAGMGAMGDMMYLRYAYHIALYHHERWDGKGYPSGLSGDQIPICAQVVGLADVFDALTTQRVYKDAIDHDTAIHMILNGQCGEFSPKLLECLKAARGPMIELAKKYADGYSPKSDEITLPLPGPVRKKYALDAMQLAQMKYQTLLHSLNDAVVELDVGNQVAYVVHNPDPNLIPLLSNVTFSELFARLRDQDPGSTRMLQKYLQEDMLEDHTTKRTITLHLLNTKQNQRIRYQVSLLRVNTGNPEQRIVLAVLRNTQHSSTDTRRTADASNRNADIYRSLQGCTVWCRNDAKLTIAQGAETLFGMTGFTAQNIAREYRDSLLAMILPEDRTEIVKRLSSGEMYRSPLELEFRMVQKNGNAIWILGKLLSYTGVDGLEYLCIAMTDITNVKQSNEALTFEEKRNRIIAEQTMGIIFSWDIQADELTCSPKWVERFGYEPIRSNFGKQVQIASHFHPDDLEGLREKINQMLTQPMTVDSDMRIANDQGRYFWSRIRATSVMDEEGKPQYIIGIIHDINELKSESIVHKKYAEQDPLTKLLNKASAQSMIEDYLQTREPSSMSALMMVDLDNFKLINDNYGHLYGDAVLTQTSTTLRSLFRSRDILARVGGDEFLIFMKDIPNLEMARERCHLVVTSLGEMLNKLMPHLNVSASVGCAVAPAHGDNYQTLFQHADQALYTAKRSGKNCSHVYTPQDQFEISSELRTRIDSNESPEMTNEMLMHHTFETLYESTDLERSIQELLGLIGIHFNVSRTYIFENNHDNTKCSNTFEWCNVGIAPAKDYLQNLDYEEDIPGWKDMYKKNPVLYCSNIEELEPVIQEVLKPQGVKSMLHCAILDQGVFRGFIGFDDCVASYMWTQEQVSMMKYMAKVLSLFLLKLRSHGRASEKATPIPETV